MREGGVRRVTQPHLEATKQRESRMPEHDVLFGYRLRPFALTGEIGVRPACRAMGVYDST
jgi:hypothetical protein